MSFKKELPEWNAPGIVPSEEAKKSGWGPNQHPPADWFNWQWNLTYQALKELQENAQHIDDSVSIADASLTQKGITQLNDKVDSDSTTQAATANAVKKVNDAVMTHSADEVKHITAAERTKWNNPATTAAKITIADTANLFTATDVEGALKELFTNANNGKTDIASVIGSPATSADTFAQLKAHIQNAKTKAATNLTAKGTNAISTETLDALMTKIASVSTGKKYASGVAKTNYYDVINVRGLGFRPKIVLITFYYSEAGGYSYSYMHDFETYGNFIGVRTVVTNSSGNFNGFSSIQRRTDNFTNDFYSDGFDASLANNTSSAKWYAWE
ncbi:phage tail protein [Peribacillus sp. NPDC046944]|uniref:phage tail protein n=1 Tax=unclassified Peribacillus TaxID=2675266 RepID=UPI003D007A80